MSAALALLLCLPSARAADPALKFLSLHAGDKPHELSGLAFLGDTLVTVRDGKKNRAVYAVVLSPGALTLKKRIKLKKLQGFDAYERHLKKTDFPLAKVGRFDLEGIATCGASVYLVNERAREALRIENGRLDIVPVKPDQEGLWTGEPNDGLEGVAADCAGSVLYLAKEGPAPFVLVVDGKAAGAAKKKSYARAAADRNPDISDLAFVDGFLYSLERNNHTIAKIDPRTFEVVARVSFADPVRGLYKTNKPKGLAEGLAISKDRIWLAIDNGERPFSKTAKAAHGVKGNGSAIVVFARPDGF